MPLLRILAILLLTLGFQIHGFAGAVTAATASVCALEVEAGPESEPGQAVPDKPSPSCKVIGAASGPLAPRHATASSVRPVAAEDGFVGVRPRGPEKPPKPA